MLRVQVQLGRIEPRGDQDVDVRPARQPLIGAGRAQKRRIVHVVHQQQRGGTPLEGRADFAQRHRRVPLVLVGQRNADPRGQLGDPRAKVLHARGVD